MWFDQYHCYTLKKPKYYLWHVMDIASVNCLFAKQECIKTLYQIFFSWFQVISGGFMLVSGSFRLLQLLSASYCFIVSTSNGLNNNSSLRTPWEKITVMVWCMSGETKVWNLKRLVYLILGKTNTRCREHENNHIKKTRTASGAHQTVY